MRKQLIVKFGADHYTLPSYINIDDAMHLLERLTPVEYIYSHLRGEIPKEFNYKEVEEKDYKKVDFELAHVWPRPKEIELEAFDSSEVVQEAADVKSGMEETTLEQEQAE